MPTPTLTKPRPVRLTIPASKKAHDVFTRMAQATGGSVGRCMAEWLDDTIEAAEFMATNMEKARLAPRLVAQEMHAYALGLADETQAVLAKLRQEGKGRTPGSASAASGLAPPSSNTGGKVPSKARKRG